MRPLFVLCSLVLLISCKQEYKKIQLKGEWTIINIDYDSTLTSLEEQEFKKNMSPYISLIKFKVDSMTVLSIDRMQEQAESVFYELRNDTIITKVYMRNDELKAFPNRRDNYYFNKFKIEKLTDDSMVLKSFYHLKKLPEKDEYEYSLDSNFYTATMILRKINSKLESDRIGWFFLNEKANQINSHNSSSNTESSDPNILSTQSFSPNSNFESTKKYGFVVMTVRQENDNVMEKMDGISYRNYMFSTAIKEYDYVNEDSKYQILDEAQAAYKRSSGAIYYKGSVKDRQLLLFDSYSEASKAREKYTIIN